MSAHCVNFSLHVYTVPETKQRCHFAFPACPVPQSQMPCFISRFTFSTSLISFEPSIKTWIKRYDFSVETRETPSDQFLSNTWKQNIILKQVAPRIDAKVHKSGLKAECQSCHPQFDKDFHLPWNSVHKSTDDFESSSVKKNHLTP